MAVDKKNLTDLSVSVFSVVGFTVSFAKVSAMITI